MSLITNKLTCNQSAIRNNQKTAKKRSWSDLTLGSFFCALCIVCIHTYVFIVRDQRKEDSREEVRLYKMKREQKRRRWIHHNYAYDVSIFIATSSQINRQQKSVELTTTSSPFFPSTPSFSTLLLYNFNKAVVAPNTTNAVLNAPDGVDVSVVNFDDMSDSIPEDEDAAAAADAPPRGMVRCNFVYEL